MLQSDFTQQRVFIVGDGSLFDEGITHLLAYETDLLVSHATYSKDLAFLNMIKSDQPDVILVSETGSLDSAHIIDSVLSYPIVIGLCIVVVRLYNNVIDVYEGPTFAAGKASRKPRRIIARTGDDLLNTVRRKYDDQ